MVLSALRTDESIIECSDKEFETAMKLTDVYLSHGLNVFETINNRKGKLPLNEEKWINSLPIDFSTEEAIKSADKLGIKERTVFKKLKKYDDDGLIQKKSLGQYKKIKV
jgi:transcriptional regulator with AAA-type ATPase domain